MKRNLTKIFIDEINSTPPKKTCPTGEIMYNHIDGIWSFDLADMVDKKISNNKRFRYIFVLTNNFRNYLWAIPLIKDSQTITDEF